MGARLKQYSDVGVTLAMLVAAALVIWRYWPQSRTLPVEVHAPSAPLDLAGSARLGRIDAPLTLVEFSDFQCPYCAKFVSNVLPTLKKEFVDNGRLAIVFKNYPLESIHPKALKAAVGAACAGQVGKFWPFHDALYAHQEELDPASLRGYAEQLGLDASAFESCIQRPNDMVNADVATAKAIGLTGTPSFLLGVTVDGGRAVNVKTVITRGATLETLRQAIGKLG